MHLVIARRIGWASTGDARGKTAYPVDYLVEFLMSMMHSSPMALSTVTLRLASLLRGVKGRRGGTEAQTQPGGCGSARPVFPQAP